MQSAFADFVATRGSRQALANVRALLDRPAGPCLVFLCGPPGVGKSHLLRAARLQHGASGRDAAVPDLVREVLGDARSRYDERLSTVDDLHVLAGMPRTQLELGRHLADRIRAGVRVVAAAGVAPTELPQLTAQLRRIDGAVFATLKPPSVREMTTILRIEASRVGVRLDAAIARKMAARCRGDVRVAQGAVARLRLTQSLEGTLLRPRATANDDGAT
jgi:chromosomal replication initiation ATPase DnaA